jgi:hypothetical protein
MTDYNLFDDLDDDPLADLDPSDQMTRLSREFTEDLVADVRELKARQVAKHSTLEVPAAPKDPGFDFGDLEDDAFARLIEAAKTGDTSTIRRIGRKVGGDALASFIDEEDYS